MPSETLSEKVKLEKVNGGFNHKNDKRESKKMGC